MGNCFACFKETSATAQTADLPHKEDMPQVRLYPAPSHHVPTHTIGGDICQTNGNVPDVTAVTIVTGVTNTNTNTISIATTITTAAVTTAVTNRLYGRKVVTVMGASESRSSDAKIQALFDIYKDKNEDVILAEGIEQFCKDLQLSPDCFKVLIVAWKMDAEQMCRFTRTEFMTGMRKMRCDTIRGLQQRLPELIDELACDERQFRELYKFTFRFGVDCTTGQRNLNREMAIILWRLVFTVREPPILNRWLTYLDTHPTVRGITSDTWNMFLFFAETVGDDLASYNDNDAWPSLFDDFVEYENDQANQNITKEKEECDEDDGRLIENDTV